MTVHVISHLPHLLFIAIVAIVMVALHGFNEVPDVFQFLFSSRYVVRKFLHLFFQESVDDVDQPPQPRKLVYVGFQLLQSGTKLLQFLLKHGCGTHANVVIEALGEKKQIPYRKIIILTKV